MAERERTYMPQGTAGLIRYFDSDEGIKLRPQYIMIAAVFFTVSVLLLKLLAPL
jgi:preprotein translocase subunit Sec61beta